MDLNKKGRSWVGNICSQIETMFQDVDNLARQEVKFVANQVNSVGDSVKRFYSDAVQDVLPSPEQNLKLEERLETSPEVDARCHVESDLGTNTEPVCFNKEDQLLVEQGPFVVLKNSTASVSVPSEYYVTEVTDLPSTYPSPEMLTYFSMKEVCDGTILNVAANTFEDYINKDLIQATANTDSNAELSDTYCNQKNVMLPMAGSPSLSISDENLANELHSNISTDDTLLDELSNIEARNSMLMAVSDCDSDHIALNEDKTLCYSIPSEDTRLDVSGQTTELVFSYSSCGDKEVETCDVSPTCSTSPEPLKIEEFMSKDFAQQAENICSSQVDSYVSACTSFAPSSTSLAYASEAMNTLPVMELNDSNSFSISKSVSNVGQSQSRHDRCCEDAQSKSVSSLSETMDILPVIKSNDLKSSATGKPTVYQSQRRPGLCHEDAQWISSSSHSESGSSSEFGAGVIVHGMETIDLSNDVKDDGRGDLVLNSNFVIPSKHRRKNFRYYKSLITDALGSRKRLSKEYEQLGILCGDIDVESRHNFDLSLVHSFTKSDNELRTESLDTSESDWELL